MVAHNFKKQLGQNFLTKTEPILNFIEALDPQAEDRILEIGPGNGALTEYIAANVAYLHLLEIDTELIPLLQEKFGFLDNVTISNQDVLKLDSAEFIKQQQITKIAGALPYNISKLIISQFCANPNLRLERCVFILQKEVAHDYAGIGKKGTFLNHLYSLYNDIYLIADIDRQSFYPSPKVDSSIIIFKPLTAEKIKLPEADRAPYTKFLKNTFLNPRKKLLKNLSNIYRKYNWQDIFNFLQFGENTRIEELSTEQVLELYQQFKSNAQK